MFIEYISNVYRIYIKYVSHISYTYKIYLSLSHITISLSLSLCSYYVLLYIILNVMIPLNTPFQYFGESLNVSMFVAFWLRSLIVLNVGNLVNSSHFIWGIRKDFKPTDSNSIFFITKSFWPQFHYLLPYDYQSGEFGDYAIGTGTTMIRVFAALNMASELRTISSTAVRQGLSTAVETKRPIVECIEEQVKLEATTLPANHFLNREKFM